MNNRLVRVREIIKREISVAIERNLAFDGALITVNSVDVTPDLKSCFIYVSILGDDRAQTKAFRILEHNAALLQGLLAKRVVLKFTPKIHFRLDDSVVRGSRIIDILDELGVEPDDDEEDPQFDPDYDEDDEGMVEDDDGK